MSSLDCRDALTSSSPKARRSTPGGALSGIHVGCAGSHLTSGQAPDGAGESACTPTEGDSMPRFMDYHDDLRLPQQAIDEIGRGAKAGESDEFGVRQVELFHNPDGKVYCLLDAPDEQAVRNHHAALDVPCGDVHRVDSLF